MAGFDWGTINKNNEEGKVMKGSAVVWLVILVLFFSTMLVYVVFSPVISSVTPEIQSFLNTTNSTIATQAGETINIIGIVWRTWPFWLILGLFIWGIVAIQKKEPYEV